MAKKDALTFTGLCVCISCTDQYRTEDFYTEVLGAELIRAADVAGLCQWYRLGDLIISIMENAEHPMPRDFYPEYAVPLLMLESSDLNAARERCIEAGIEIEEWHEDDFMMISDPDGLPIEIYQRFPDDDPPPSRRP